MNEYKYTQQHLDVDPVVQRCPAKPLQYAAPAASGCADVGTLSCVATHQIPSHPKECLSTGIEKLNKNTVVIEAAFINPYRLKSLFSQLRAAI